MNAHIKQIDIMFPWDIVRIDISDQHGCFSSVCVLVDYCYQMNTDGDTNCGKHAYAVGSAQQSNAAGSFTQHAY